MALLLVFGICINPVIPSSSSAYAEGGESGQGGGVQAGNAKAASDIVPENGVALRIDTALDSNNTVEEQVVGSGTQYIKVDFTVGANNIQNYDVYVQADSTALTGASHGDKLQSINGNSVGTVGAMQWGYSVERGDVEPSTMTYKPIQTSVSTSADGQDAGEGKTLTGISQPYTLAFAANLEGATADHYKSNITLSVAAGATDTVKTGLGFAGIEYMQEMNQVACYRAAEGEEGRLKDIRDGKVYWVAKLKDGNCWMTQNLDLDLASRRLTTGDSDVSSDWGSTTGASTLWTGSSSNYYIVKYYDPGEYVYTKPTSRLSSGCGLLSSDSCKAAGWELISGASTDNTGSETTHYLVGNYYSLEAATAGTAPSAAGIATSSICPKGWQLPVNSGDKSYTTLLTSYGTNSGLLYGTQDIRLAPLYFVYGGRVYSSALGNAGSSGHYWSSMADSSTGAYNLILETGVGFNISSRYNGFSVRCVAR